MKPNPKTMKAGRNFDREVDSIIRKRFGGIDKDLKIPISKERITDAIPECEAWKNVKRELENKPRKEKLKW